MLRVILLHYLLPLVLPTAVYVVWLKAQGSLSQTSHWKEMPWAWLIGAGGLMVVVGVVISGLLADGGTASTYVPAEYRDGRIVPGHFEPRPAP